MIMFFIIDGEYLFHILRLKAQDIRIQVCIKADKLDQ